MATKSFTVTTRDGSTRTVTPAKDWRNNKASKAQVRYIKHLMETRVLDDETVAKVAKKAKNPKAGGASDTIKLLLTCPER